MPMIGTDEDIILNNGADNTLVFLSEKDLW